MLNAYERGLFEVLDPYLTVHDELDSGVPPTAAGAEAARELIETMCTPYPLSVPVLAGSDFGRNWGELQEVDPAQIAPSALRALLLPPSSGEGC